MPAIKRCEDCGPDSKLAPFTFPLRLAQRTPLLLEESEGRTDAVCADTAVCLRENGAMTKTEYAQYLASEDWRERRKKFIAEANNECERCDLPRWLASLVYDQDLHVHHLNYQNLGNEESDDLEVLCRRCHEIETFGRSDYGEIKKAECSLCGLDHFNIYSDYCGRCRLLCSMDEPFFFNFDKLNKTGELWWRQEISDAIIHNYIDVPVLLNEIALTLRKCDDQRRNSSQEKGSRETLQPAVPEAF
jgi:hypothetical protein